jgi:hypothetical protein
MAQSRKIMEKLGVGPLFRERGYALGADTDAQGANVVAQQKGIACAVRL